MDLTGFIKAEIPDALVEMQGRLATSLRFGTARSTACCGCDVS